MSPCIRIETLDRQFQDNRTNGVSVELSVINELLASITLTSSASSLYAPKAPTALPSELGDSADRQYSIPKRNQGQTRLA